MTAAGNEALPTPTPGGEPVKAVKRKAGTALALQLPLALLALGLELLIYFSLPFNSAWLDARAAFLVAANGLLAFGLAAAPGEALRPGRRLGWALLATLGLALGLLGQKISNAYRVLGADFLASVRPFMRDMLAAQPLEFWLRPALALALLLLFFWLLLGWGARWGGRRR